MPDYRFYFIKHDGHIEGPGQDYEAPDDVTAIDKAKQLVDGHDIEVWQGPRMVAYVVPEEPKQPPPSDHPTPTSTK